MTPEEFTEIRARHYHDPLPRGDRCRGCRAAWPCDAVRLLDALQEAEAARVHVRGLFEAEGERAEKAEAERDALLDALQRADSRYETCLADYKHAVRSLEKAESELARVSEVLIQRLADLRALRDEYERVVAALRELAEEKRQVGAGWFIARARAVLAGLQDEHSSDPRCCPEYDEQRIMEHLDGFRVIIDGLAESIRDEDAFKAHMFDAIAWNCRAHGLFGAFGWKMRARAAEAELAELRGAVPSDAEPEQT